MMHDKKPSEKVRYIYTMVFSSSKKEIYVQTTFYCEILLQVIFLRLITYFSIFSEFSIYLISNQKTVLNWEFTKIKILLEKKKVNIPLYWHLSILNITLSVGHYILFKIQTILFTWNEALLCSTFLLPPESHTSYLPFLVCDSSLVPRMLVCMVPFSIWFIISNISSLYYSCIF